MGEENRVLVVDNHLDMHDFLRSILELAVENCQVVGVSTAEDGAKALKSTSFRLMIADMGLPGMGGTGLVHHAKRIWPDMEIILMSDTDTARVRKEAEELKVFRYYPKPLDSDDLIYSVYKLLHDPNAAENEGERSKLPRIKKEVKVASPELLARLEQLRVDIGARQALLANLSGDVLISTRPAGKINLLDKVDSVADNVRASVELGLKLGNKNPYSIQYLSGEEYEVYTANLKPDHWLALLFEIQEKRGKMGTIWFFTQKAIPDLEELIIKVEGGKATTSRLASEDESAVAGKDIATKELSGAEPEESASDLGAVAGEELQTADQFKDQDAIAAKTPKSQGEMGTEAAEEEIPGVVSHDETQTIETDEWEDFVPAAHLVDIDKAAAKEKDDLDLFWEEASETDLARKGSAEGMSYEEAVRQGLIPGEIELPEED